MEKFLICGDCTTPIGFPHESTCNNVSGSANEMNFTWRKNKIDDKFITYAMEFSFNELITPASKKDILNVITRACEKQKRQSRRTRVSFPPASRCWPWKWIRNANDRNKHYTKLSQHYQQQKTANRNKVKFPVFIAHPPIFHPSIWTPTKDEDLLSEYEIVSFSYQKQQENEFPSESLVKENENKI
jgi:hypothetical protein